MNVLHLCSYYYGSKLYENLIKELDSCGLKQSVYIPVMQGVKCEVKDYNNCRFLVKETYGSLDRLFFKGKFKKNYKELLSNVDISKVNVVHAHTLFTNGVMAYKIKKEYNIPYIVAVRNSDVNTFFKYFIHLRSLGVNILKDAEKVIFISPAYLEDTINRYVPDGYKEEIRKKSVVIPNGVNEFWIDNLGEPKEFDKTSGINLVYAGEITENKNIHKIIMDVDEMNKSGMNVKYSVVGDGPYESEIKALVAKNNLEDKVKLYGRINDKMKLKDILMENDIFVMTSTYETFGLSYIEAFSQGLPALYTKGQGIDGFFKEGHVGYNVKLGDSIEKRLTEIIDNYNEMSINCVNVTKDFKWDKIADNYVKIYESIG